MKRMMVPTILIALVATCLETLMNQTIVLTKLRNNGFGQSGTIIAAINLSDPDKMTVAYAHIES